MAASTSAALASAAMPTGSPVPGADHVEGLAALGVSEFAVDEEPGVGRVVIGIVPVSL